MIFFFNDTATTEIYTLSLHDALPISVSTARSSPPWACSTAGTSSKWTARCWLVDRKSTRLNSSHQIISYAVFCLKKKKLARHLWTPNNQYRGCALSCIHGVLLTLLAL